MRKICRHAVVSVVVLLGAWPARAQTTASPPAEAVRPNDYSDGKTWLCRPGRHDACDVDLTATVIAANGALAREGWTADPDASIDCFYVYPTVSTDPTPNSDMNADPPN